MTYLCLMAATHGLYAEAFLREAKARGHRVVVLTQAEALGYAWPREAIDALHAVPNLFDAKEVKHAVGYLARQERIDRLVGLGEYDIEIAATLREHFRVKGMGETTARYFRDKLAMREKAEANGIPIPPFVPLIHHPAIAEFMQRQPGPWLIKPRSLASSKGIQVLHHPDEVWAALHRLGDAAPEHLMEGFVTGPVFHVDGVVSGREVVFASAHRYGRPILDLHTRGGVYTTWRLQEEGPEAQALLELNRRVVAAFGLAAGVFHIEYIRASEGPATRPEDFRFLEASCRVGAGLIEEMVEAEAGINLWAEWAKLEEGELRPPYLLQRQRERYAGVLATATAARQPDPSPYLGEGVRAVPAKPHHLGLVVEGASEAEVSARLQALAERVGQDLTVRLG